jgi:hypothetical protein
LFAISFLYHCSGVFAQLFLLLLDGVYLNAVPVPNKPPLADPPPPPPPPPPDAGAAVFVGAADVVGALVVADGAGVGAAGGLDVAGIGAGGGAASNNQSLKFKFMLIYMYMNIEFKRWLLKIEMAGTNAIVSCKDKDNPNFQIWGAMSDLGCNKKKKSKKK